jgi:hypothetical protein
MVGEYRDHLKTESQLDQLLGVKPKEEVWLPVENVFPGGLEALKTAGISSFRDVEELTRVIEKLPGCAHRDKFKVMVMDSGDGDGAVEALLERVELVIRSAELIALLRFSSNTLTEPELVAVGHGLHPGNLPVMQYEPRTVTECVDRLVNFWKIQYAQRTRKEIKLEKKAAHKEEGIK